MECKDTVFEVQHVTKLYGLNKPEASHMMSNGSTKKEVQKKTGVCSTVGYQYEDSQRPDLRDHRPVRLRQIHPGKML